MVLRKATLTSTNSETQKRRRWLVMALITLRSLFMTLALRNHNSSIGV